MQKEQMERYVEQCAAADGKLEDGAAVARQGACRADHELRHGRLIWRRCRRLAANHTSAHAMHRAAPLLLNISFSCRLRLHGSGFYVCHDREQHKGAESNLKFVR